ncbi:unnamed protein product [Protopolystoma xenopodis]|uniref:Uncharacterized protein n=1 Tax=Protopolystoma xenopodis TaxID=117903 RepID=A0A448XNF6_9PLAT|nr:unnamed protein product [Protopolystoma xenopodis]
MGKNVDSKACPGEVFSLPALNTEYTSPSCLAVWGSCIGCSSLWYHTCLVVAVLNSGAKSHLLEPAASRSFQA